MLDQTNHAFTALLTAGSETEENAIELVTEDKKGKMDSICSTKGTGTRQIKLYKGRIQQREITVTKR